MPKIILVSNTEWYLYNFRRSLASYLSEQGFEVVLASPSGPYVQELKTLGFRWIPWEVGRQTVAPWWELGALLQLVRIYRREKPDLVHHHTIKPALYGSLAARTAGVKGVISSITGRGYVFLGADNKARVLRWFVRWMYQLAFQPANCIAIFENQTDREYFITMGLMARDHTSLIESVGVDPQQFTPLPEPEGTPVILQASRMLWDKGVGILVEAARLLHKDTSVRVALAGEPDAGNPASIPEHTLRSWDSEGVVEWWGFQPDMNATYNRSHIVTLPSLGEGFPTGLLEAASCGRPIVATDVPGCRDFMIDGFNGLLVPPSNPRALAEALKMLASNPALRNKMGRAGRKLVVEKYTTERVNEATMAIYDRFL